MTQPSTRRRPQGPTGSTRRTAGFTLIELMIAVAIVGILASIAYPSYQRYVQDARRADVQTTMMEAAGVLERCYTVSSSYGNCAGVAGILADSDFYSFELTPETPTTGFQIEATPIGPQADDRCGSLMLSHTGERDAALQGCW